MPGLAVSDGSTRAASTAEATTEPPLLARWAPLLGDVMLLDGIGGATPRGERLCN